MSDGGTVRVDKWLWAVRVFPSRTSATEACSAGRVSVNDDTAKPATKISVGDVVTARRRDREVVYVVEAVIDKRVSAARAADCFEDRSPPKPERSALPPAPPGGARSRGEGRPTKRDRRRLDRLRGRSPR